MKIIPSEREYFKEKMQIFRGLVVLMALKQSYSKTQCDQVKYPEIENGDAQRTFDWDFSARCRQVCKEI